MDYKEKYEKLHKNTLASLQQMVSEGKITEEIARSICADFVKESDDERIRRDIIRYLKKTSPAIGGNIEKMLAWLEKQGEQKPADKIELKFKTGDWIVYCNEDVDLLTGIEDNGYLINKGGYIPFTSQGDMRYWTIQDAKDGDVLATDNDSICVFDGMVEDGKYPFAYCGLTRHHGFELYDRKLPFTHADVHPATKEQRDLLFAKMKEAGYEWDVEKNELKKIEQKSVWSEEDENMLQKALSTIRYALSIPADKEDDPCFAGSSTIAWLKSLKERVQSQSN